MYAAKFKTEEELDKRCKEYFKDCIKSKDKKLPSKAGLLVKLDLGRTQYNEYKKKYPNAVKKAENIIEEAWVQRLSGAAATGAIFYLKNAFKENYKDRREFGGDFKGKLTITFDNAITSNTPRKAKGDSKK